MLGEQEEDAPGVQAVEELRPYAVRLGNCLRDGIAAHEVMHQLQGSKGLHLPWITDYQTEASRRSLPDRRIVAEAQAYLVGLIHGVRVRHLDLVQLFVHAGSPGLDTLAEQSSARMILVALQRRGATPRQLAAFDSDDYVQAFAALSQLDDAELGNRAKETYGQLFAAPAPAIHAADDERLCEWAE